MAARFFVRLNTLQFVPQIVPYCTHPLADATNEYSNHRRQCSGPGNSGLPEKKKNTFYYHRAI